MALGSFAERLECVPRILSALNRRLEHPIPRADLPDLVQDTLVVIVKKIDEFEGRATLETWVYRICFLELRSALRRRTRSKRESAPIEGLPVEAEAVEAEVPEDYTRLYGCLAELDVDERVVITLKHFEDLSFSQVAERLGISLGTAKTRYYRGTQRLLVLLGSGYDEGQP